MARTLYFELHIRPLFREIDRLHMLGVNPDLDLWSYDSLASVDDDTGQLWRDRVREFAEALDEPLQLMPPPSNSGPWPEEWLSLYRRWLDTEAKQLPRATATTMNVVKQGPVYLLKVTGTKKGSDYAVWLDREPGREEPPIFIVYEQPPEDHVPATGTTFSVTEFFEAKGAKTVRLIDANGTHDLAIPP
jgi:hypothetical protein